MLEIYFTCNFTASSCYVQNKARPTCFSQAWILTGAVAMKMAYIYTSRCFNSLPTNLPSCPLWEWAVTTELALSPFFHLSRNFKGGCHYIDSGDAICFPIWGNANKNGVEMFSILIRGGLFPQSSLTWHLLVHWILIKRQKMIKSALFWRNTKIRLPLRWDKYTFLLH